MKSEGVPKLNFDTPSFFPLKEPSVNSLRIEYLILHL